MKSFTDGIVESVIRMSHCSINLYYCKHNWDSWR